jgi:ROS/MUCR transcriptional regulator protein
MATEASAPERDLNRVAHIVSSYARHHQLGPEQLVELIKQMHRALASLGQAALPMAEIRQPAVPIRQRWQLRRSLAVLARSHPALTTVFAPRHAVACAAFQHCRHRSRFWQWPGRLSKWRSPGFWKIETKHITSENQQSLTWD